MSNAPDDLKAFRLVLMTECGFADPAEVGVVADQAHLSNGGYHCGALDLKSIGRLGLDYSSTTARDRLQLEHDLPRGVNDASAVDIGDDWPRGGRAGWLRFNRLLLAQMQAGDPDLIALRAINFSPDGTVRRRFDTAHRSDGVVSSGDNVDVHTHLEFWRDTAGTAARTRATYRIVAILRAARDNVSLDVTTPSTTGDSGMFLVRFKNADGSDNAGRYLSNGETGLVNAATVFGPAAVDSYNALKAKLAELVCADEATAQRAGSMFRPAAVDVDEQAIAQAVVAAIDASGATAVTEAELQAAIPDIAEAVRVKLGTALGNG